MLSLKLLRFLFKIIHTVACNSPVILTFKVPYYHTRNMKNMKIAKSSQVSVAFISQNLIKIQVTLVTPHIHFFYTIRSIVHFQILEYKNYLNFSLMYCRDESSVGPQYQLLIDTLKVWWVRKLWILSNIFACYHNSC
jgi:hypothetical protein